MKDVEKWRCVRFALSTCVHGPIKLRLQARKRHLISLYPSFGGCEYRLLLVLQPFAVSVYNIVVGTNGVSQLNRRRAQHCCFYDGLPYPMIVLEVTFRSRIRRSKDVHCSTRDM